MITDKSVFSEIAPVSTSIRESEEMCPPAAHVPAGPHRRALDEYLFHAGKARHAWAYLGAHAECDPAIDGGNERMVFRVWAPHARSVSVVGSFTDWEVGIPMARVTANGLFLLSLSGAEVPDGSAYKYRIEAANGQVYLRSDPYGRAMECPPLTATRILREKPFVWHDRGWLAQRDARRATGRQFPFNIYEVHSGSWKYRDDGTPLTYRELADELAPYLKQMGFTHVELMPVMEHPFGGSWGYQVCGYYAPTARYGDPDDFRAFVDILHGAGIGVILDWVPAHFPRDAHGLFHFDGEPLYEYSDPTRQENKGWGTCCFDVGKPEVISFLISNAYYWIEEFHADGLRVDAVSSMLYLNYDRRDGEWHPNRFGDFRNLESIAFFRLLNESLRADHPSVMTIAEESTIWAHITDFSSEGLGFSYKWNMGWMNDTLRYVKEDPLFRKHNHVLITHCPEYAFDEHYVLPISHDEVVHLKKSFLDKMPGDYWQKFAGARAFAAWMMTHPGAKLWFMGCEIGQFAEWSEERQLDWHLLRYDAHARLQHYFAALNNLYLATPALWDVNPDDPKSAFGWLESNLDGESTVAYRRTACGTQTRKGHEVVVVINFTPPARPSRPINVPTPGTYREIFNSDDLAFGGSGFINTEPLASYPVEGSLLHKINLNIPPMGCSILERIPDSPAYR